MVQRDQPAGANAQERVGLDDVRADVRDQVHLGAEQRAVVPGCQLQVDLGRIFGMVVHILFARQGHLDRAVGLQGQGRADGDHRVHLDAGTERAPDRHALHVDLAQRDVEDLAEEYAHVVDGLGRRPDGRSAIRLRPAHGSLGLHLHVVDLRRLEVAAHEPHRPRQTPAASPSVMVRSRAHCVRSG